MVEWIKKSIGELFSISGGRSASRVQLSDNGYFYLHYGDIHASTKTYIDTDEDKAVIPRLNVPLNKVSAGSLLQDGDVVFVDASEDDIGASRHIVVRNTGKVPFIAGLHTIVAKPLTNETERAYREYCFQTTDVIRQFKHYAVGTKVTGVSKTTIKKICILFPKSLSEQRAIASALSDADGYIVALERLIAKKRDIKQGAMQELLRPKDGWEEKTLSELCEIRDGTHQTPQYKKYGVPFYSVENVTNDDFSNVKYISLEEHKKLTSSYQIEKGDIIMTRIGSIGVCKYVDWDVNASFYVSLALLKCKSSITARFLCFISQTEVFKKEIMLHSLQHAIPQKINLGNISLVRIMLPSITEQTCIVSILSDMDSEIDELTAKLNKAKLIKQGMMEQLLTGKIRLAETETASVAKTEENRKQGYKEGYRDAVILVALVKTFGTEEHPFTAFDCQKFPYLFHRHVEGNATGYKKMPAGPYNPSLEYRTAKPIALSKKYICEHTGKYKGFVVTDNADEALRYFAKWYGDEPLKWLVEHFLYLSNRKDELELLTTIDKAMLELRSADKLVNTQAVKDIINKDSAWKDKLKRPIFSDANITRAIKWSNELFGQEVTGNA